jgi:CubicO group peptidase (beta-lactamase class C family)
MPGSSRGKAWARGRGGHTIVSPTPTAMPKPKLPAQLLLFLATAAFPGPAAAPLRLRAEPARAAAQDELAGRLDSLLRSLDEQRVSLHLPGLALAIVRDGELVLARGLGLADIEGTRAVEPETVFAIGSTTKAFTATLVGMLADEGKLAFDDPITKHLPWFQLPIDGRGPVELQDLLSHRTGFARMDVLWYGGHATQDEVLRTAIGAEPLAPFRTKFLYNNIMFLAAGAACSQVTGKSWEELVQTRILAPLGMKATTTSTVEAQRSPDLAFGYRWDEDKNSFVRVPMRDLHAISPAGSINSNVLDLVRWMRFLLAEGEFEGQRLISSARLAETWKPHNEAGGVRYGLGWMLGNWNGKKTVFHGGNIDGFAAQIALLPEEHLGVALLANVGMTPLQNSIGALVFEALLGAAPAAAAGVTPAAPAEDSTRFLGTYVANFFQFKGARFEVLARDGKLAVDVPSQTTFELGPPDARGRRPFAAVPDQIQASFVEADGKVVALVMHQAGFDFECYREGYEPPPELSQEDLEPYLGSFADPFTKKNFTLVVQHGRLSVDYPGQMVYELLQPKDDERWVFRSNAQFAIEFVIEEDDEGEGEAPEQLVFHERGTQRVCERVGRPVEPPTLDALMALRAEAFEARLAALGTCRLEGSLRLVSCGIRGRVVLVFEPGERFRDMTDLAPFVTSSTLYDGRRAVARTSLGPEQELLGDNLDQARAGNLALLLGDWRKRFDEARVLRVQTEEGRALVLVRLVKGAAPPMTLAVDAKSGDLVRAEIQELVDGVGALSKTLRFEDWREYEGLRLPSRIVSEDEATGRAVMEYTSLTPGASETWTAEPSEASPAKPK